MQSQQSVEEWARTAEFSTPVRWGEIEKTVLAGDVPPDGEETPKSRALVLIAWVCFVVVGLVTLGAPVLALALIVAGTARGGVDPAENWFLAAALVFIVAIVVQLLTLNLWWELRRRPSMLVLSHGVAVVASAASALVVVLVDTAQVKWGYHVLLLITGILGAVGLVLHMVSKPEGRGKKRKPPR